MKSCCVPMLLWTIDRVLHAHHPWHFDPTLSMTTSNRPNIKKNRKHIKAKPWGSVVSQRRRGRRHPGASPFYNIFLDIDPWGWLLMRVSKLDMPWGWNSSGIPGYQATPPLEKTIRTTPAVYPLVKCGEQENPRTQWRLTAGKIFSSKPCLIPGE